MRTAHGMCLLLCGQSECDWADAARLTSVIGALLLFAAPGDRVIGFEVEVGPVLLDPGGGVVEVVKAARRGDWLGGWGRRGSGLGLRLGQEDRFAVVEEEFLKSLKHGLSQFTNASSMGEQLG